MRFVATVLVEPHVTVDDESNLFDVYSDVVVIPVCAASIISRHGTHGVAVFTDLDAFKIPLPAKADPLNWMWCVFSAFSVLGSLVELPHVRVPFRNVMPDFDMYKSTEEPSLKPI